MTSSSCTAAPPGCAWTMGPSSPPRPSWTGASCSASLSATSSPGSRIRMPSSSGFNRTFREEVLDAYLFDSLEQAQEITDAWLATYNTERPHDSLGQVPPLVFLPRPNARAESSFEVST